MSDGDPRPAPPARRSSTRLDNYVDRYAARTKGMTASEIRALFSVASRPEVVSLAGGMPNISGLPLDVVGGAINDLVRENGATAMQYGSGQGDEALRSATYAQAATAGLNDLLALLDARLAAQPWMLGTDYSLVDLVVGSVLGYSVYLGAPVKAHPHVQAWLERVQARPAMQVEG